LLVNRFWIYGHETMQSLFVYAGAEQCLKQCGILCRVAPPGFPPQELVRVARLSAGLDALNPRSWIAVLRLGFAALRA
jgi:hypothetical protein